MTIKKIIRTIILLLNTKMIVSLARMSHDFGLYRQYQPIPIANIAMDLIEGRNKSRFEAIKNNLPKEKCCGLDLGCNIGYFVFALAEQGYQMFGIEGDSIHYSILNAVRNQYSVDNVNCSNYFITPQNVEYLPSVDFILCLSLFHHWCLTFGESDALYMLDTILKKVKYCLYFEPPYARDSSRKYKLVLPDRAVDDPEDWWVNYFKEKRGMSVKSIYKDNRTIFLISIDI